MVARSGATPASAPVASEGSIHEVGTTAEATTLIARQASISICETVTQRGLGIARIRHILACLYVLSRLFWTRFLFSFFDTI